MASRLLFPSDDTGQFEALVEAIVRENAPAVLEIDGCDALSAAELGLAAGDNPERMRSEASFVGAFSLRG